MSIYLHKVKSRWQPGENTVMYFPFVEDQADKIGSATINVTGTKDSVIGYTFDKQGELLVNNPPTTCRFISVWVRYNQSHGTYVQSPSTYIGQVLYNFSHGTSGWSKKFQIQTSSSNYSLSSEQNTATGVWYHLAMGYDGSKVVAYLNGSKVWEETVSAYTSGTMRFGDDINETVSEYIGESVCRTAEEVEDYYMLTKGDYYTETQWEVNENTVAYYPLTENFNDTSGNGYDLTVSNATITTLNGVKCASYTGGRAYNATPAVGSTRTLVAWFYNQTAGVLVGTGADQSGYSAIMMSNNGDKIQISDFNTTGYSSSSISSNSWHLGVAVADGANMYIYVDGVLANSGTHSNTLNSTGVSVGGKPFTNQYTDYFSGYLSNAIVENKARTADEVLSYYYQTRNDYVDDPWYPVKEYEVQNIYIGEYVPPTPTDFEYTGAEQCATLPRGTYCLEVWGAQGGSCARVGGFGGYSSGKIKITQNTVAYIQVGGAGTTGTGVDGGYNGGGRACSINNRSMTSGGGGTDIRLGTNDLYHRVIVAGGGGGGAETNYGCGTGLNGAGGGLNGINNCGSSDRRYGYGGTQTSGGAARTETNWDSSYITTCLVGKFGQGGGADGISTAYINGGGGGWYGGGAGGPDGGAGGGSGYIWSATSCSCHPNQSCMSGICYMTDGILCAGNTTFPSPSGGTETGHSGCGYARITPIN